MVLVCCYCSFTLFFDDGTLVIVSINRTITSQIKRNSTRVTKKDMNNQYFTSVTKEFENVGKSLAVSFGRAILKLFLNEVKKILNYRNDE